jgi:hypothetical protein
MRRARFPIAGWMAAVTAVAVNLAVMRSFNATRSDSLPHLFFACGVMPMASVLFLVALFSAPNLMRGGRLNPFAFGFGAFGCVALFAYASGIPPESVRVP